MQHFVSPGQIACLLTYAGFLALWAYAELVNFSRCSDTCLLRKSIVLQHHLNCLTLYSRFLDPLITAAEVAESLACRMRSMAQVRNHPRLCSLWMLVR